MVDFFLARSKAFRLDEILNDSADAVKATTNHAHLLLHNTSNSGLVGNITGLFFCIFIKLCHPRIFRILYSRSIFEKSFQMKECRSLY